MKIDEAIKQASNKPMVKDDKKEIKKYHGMTGMHKTSTGWKTDDPRGANIFMGALCLTGLIAIIVAIFAAG